MIGGTPKAFNIMFSFSVIDSWNPNSWKLIFEIVSNSNPPSSIKGRRPPESGLYLDTQDSINLALIFSDKVLGLFKN